MSELRLYSLFHLNLAYSSIEEEQRSQVIETCYRPLLRVVEQGVPLGLEMSGHTLEAIAHLDPGWVETFRTLLKQGSCELVGSGYAQLIGPLVPTEVNGANLRLGLETYEKILGVRPHLALVNEQAYASGLVSLYLEAGLEGIVMEWDNPHRFHKEWVPSLRYLPQRARGQSGASIPLLWNNSIAFQKFQRYAHDEMSLDDYLAYLEGRRGTTTRAFSLYGNDAEIFDFRPGRYHTEAALGTKREWHRIEALYERLGRTEGISLVSPSSVLELMDHSGAGHELQLESAEQPIPVKKQGKYNVSRWAVTGRDDIGINTRCHGILQALNRKKIPSDENLKELCALWSSDYRTHITDKRWERHQKRLTQMEDRFGILPVAQTSSPCPSGKRINAGETFAGFGFEVTRQKRYLVIETESVKAVLNCRRGLAIDKLWLGDKDGEHLCGTLHHGYYDDISLGNDYYTGHLVLEVPGRPKVTDLEPVEPHIKDIEDGVVVSGTVQTRSGPVIKTLTIGTNRPRVHVEHALAWDRHDIGALRLGHLTLNPKAFDIDSLSFATHNGGAELEEFELAGRTALHGEAVSFLVSASAGVGMTQGRCRLGDERRAVWLEFDPAQNAFLGLLTHKAADDTFFTRLSLSAGEVDETRKGQPGGSISVFRYSIVHLPL